MDGILVFLQDVLMPRKLEAHLDDDFQAVRVALRRRMDEADDFEWARVRREGEEVRPLIQPGES